MQAGGGTKNPPWARSNVNTNMTGMNPQIMDPNAMMSQQGMMQYQQTPSVFNTSMMQAQGGMAMPMAGQMQMNQLTQGQIYPGNVVAYPAPRGMNPGLYQNAQSTAQPNNAEQRVFTGTVTKTHNEFGFVDHDVFYQTSVCAKGMIPKVNDRVLVEATYNGNMPFKWNATRVQVLPKSGPIQKPNNPKSNSYNAVPPPSKKTNPLPNRRDIRDERPLRRDDREIRKRSRTRSRSRSRGDSRRDSRSRRDSPPRKRAVVREPTPVKYTVRVPRIPLDIQKLDVPGVSHRYNNLYVPSDFFNANIKWGEAFPPQNPFSLNNPCSYHIMTKEIENPNNNESVLEPPDADYRFSAKVMLISMPTLETMYQKCGLTKCDDKDKRSTKSPQHPTRLVRFLVGQKSKGGENFAIGGPWSPSLDGENPQNDPGVLVKTAIRTCKALTGIDLSSCTQWYRMVEFYYWREGSGGKSRLECVVLFLPDVWSAQPSRIEWANVQDQYKAACETAIKKLDGEENSVGDVQPGAAAAAEPAVDAAQEKSQIEKTDPNDSTITIDENDDDDDQKPEPLHYSKIDLRTFKVDQLRQELRARDVSCKGVRAQLVSRLSKLLKKEEEQDSKSDDVMEVEEDETQNKESNEQKKDEEDKVEEKVVETKVEEVLKEDVEIKEDKEKPQEKKKEKTEKELEEEKKKIEKQKVLLKKYYELPSTPHFVVHPSNSAKGGKFNCTLATLSLLLDYRVTDNKEHSFEIFVFAELFNEMLMRDFGFYLYKTLYTLPEKTEELKEGKEKEKTSDKTEKPDEKKEEGEKKEEKKEEKKDDKEKKEDDKKRDDKRDTRRRERRESHSDDERSSSPKRRGRGVDLPPDPYLLLSLVYFDTARNHSIIKKDLQNLFMSLGLLLSRSQIRNVLEKVCVKDTFNYKVLVQAIKDLASGSPDAMQDLPLDSTVTATEVPTEISDLEATIATGNRNLLPLFNRDDKEGATSETKDISDTGIVTYKCRVVDVGALVAGAARAASTRARLEAALESARSALRSARAAAEQRHLSERGAHAQLSDATAHLAAARTRIASLTASSKIFHSALKSIQSKVEAVVNIKYEDDDVVEIVNGPTKNQKEVKIEVKKDEVEIIEKETEAVSESKPTSITSSEDTKDKEKDIIVTENMEIVDDKE